MNFFKLSTIVLCVMTMTGCATGLQRNAQVSGVVAQDIRDATQLLSAKPKNAKAGVTTSFVNATGSDAIALPDARKTMSDAANTTNRTEPRLDLVVKSAPARDVLTALVAESPYSIVLHPDVKGNVSLTLRRVTLKEALETIRDVYGFDIKTEGSRIMVYPPTIQTKTYSVNYLSNKRTSSSLLRVGGQNLDVSSNSNGGASTSTTKSVGDSSNIATSMTSDLWSEVIASIKGIVGTDATRSVNATPQASVITVKAMPSEHRQVATYLNSIRSIIERQVMIEAKIIDVNLSDTYQSGVDWANLVSSNDKTLGISSLGNLDSSGVVALASAASPGTLAVKLAGVSFVSALSFLETFGDLNVLSSPRVATLNSQSALLKVGSDDFYLTGVSGGSTTAATAGSAATNTMPNLTWTPFFSGIALDVTPQIDDDDNIMLHIRPSVSTVVESRKNIDLGSQGQYVFPLASSKVNETDTIVRVKDQSIVAIGGLMQSDAQNFYSGAPGTSGKPMLDTLFGNKTNSAHKRELVVLLKTTILRDADSWKNANSGAQERLEDLNERMRVPASRVIQFSSNEK